MKSELLELKYNELHLLNARDRGWIWGFISGCFTVVIVAVVLANGVL
jgi:hypothetical protein